MQNLSNQFCGPRALPGGGLGCIPPTTALLKGRVPQIPVLGVIQDGEEQDRGPSWAGPLMLQSACTALAASRADPLHVPGRCTVVRGPGFPVGSWEAHLAPVPVAWSCRGTGPFAALPSLSAHAVCRASGSMRTFILSRSLSRKGPRGCLSPVRILSPHREGVVGYPW